VPDDLEMADQFTLSIAEHEGFIECVIEDPTADRVECRFAVRDCVSIFCGRGEAKVETNRLKHARRHRNYLRVVVPAHARVEHLARRRAACGCQAEYVR